MWYLSTREVPTWIWYESLNSDSCDKIIKELKPFLKSGKVGTVVETRDDNNVRNSDIVWINDYDKYGWIYDACAQMVNYANNEYFKYDLDYIENLQFTCYDSTKNNQHYGKHVDTLTVSPNKPRKLSFSILLSDPQDFEGGDLICHDESNPKPAKKQKGTGIIFPSHTLHEVTPVTKGTRYSLVGWVSGPHFR